MDGRLYLGDSVYIDFDGYSIILTTHNGYPDDPRNIIYLEPEVVRGLLLYIERLKSEQSSKRNQE